MDAAVKDRPSGTRRRWKRIVAIVCPASFLVLLVVHFAPFVAYRLMVALMPDKDFGVKRISSLPQCPDAWSEVEIGGMKLVLPLSEVGSLYCGGNGGAAGFGLGSCLISLGFDCWKGRAIVPLEVSAPCQEVFDLSPDLMVASPEDLSIFKWPSENYGTLGLLTFRVVGLSYEDVIEMENGRLWMTIARSRRTGSGWSPIDLKISSWDHKTLAHGTIFERKQGSIGTEDVLSLMCGFDLSGANSEPGTTCEDLRALGERIGIGVETVSADFIEHVP